VSQLKTQLRTWLEIGRPFSWTASIVPVCLGGSIAFRDGHFSATIFLLALLASVLLQAGTNVINEVFDVRSGVDTYDSPRASRTIVEERLDSTLAYRGGLFIFLVAVLIGIYLIYERGYAILLIGMAAILIGYTYTAPPIQFKYRALGVPVVFWTMGPFMVLSAYYVLAQSVTWEVFFASIPVGFLVASILHANDVRDIEDDARAGFRTLALSTGRNAGAILHLAMIGTSFTVVILLVALTIFPSWSLITLIALPPTLQATVAMIRGGVGPKADPIGYLPRIDEATAKVHLLFGLLFCISYVIAGLSS
jgi:1,4-dihydroxy-2-naphthoate octaprenyltransferase